jgi:hypothetical protein
MVLSMLKFNLVLALLFVNISVFADDEKFIGCVIERMKKSNPYSDSDTTEGLTKRNEPLISIKDGKFTMLTGNHKSADLFPDGIEYHSIGEPILIQHSNSYSWNYSKFDYISRHGDTPMYKDWKVILNRENLDMSHSYRYTDIVGNKYASDKYYSCRLIDKVSFEKYKKEISEENMKLNSDARKKEKEEQAERERKSKI